MSIGFELMSGEKGRDLALLLLRLALGGVFIFHGVHKLMGMEGTIAFFGTIGFAAWVAWLVAITETVTGVMMVVGAFTNVAAWIMALILAVAIIKVHFVHGFWVMNSGYEYALFMLLTAVAVAHLGHGNFAICRKCTSESGKCSM